MSSALGHESWSTLLAQPWDALLCVGSRHAVLVGRVLFE